MLVSNRGQEEDENAPFLAPVQNQGIPLYSALIFSLACHGLLLALPVEIHESRINAERLVPPIIEVRLDPAARLRPDPSPVVPREQPLPPPQSGVPVPVHYYESAEVDVRAEPIAIEPLTYPEDAYLRRIPGIVKVRIFINETGDIDAADILSAEPPELFERAALDALLQTRFKPAQILGVAVKSVKIVVVNFDPFVDHP